MSRNIIITQETLDGESVKSVTVEVNENQVKEYYAYPPTTEDTTITTEVNADLDGKGYPE